MEKELNTPQYIKQVPWYAQDANGGGQLIKIPVYEPKGFLQDWYNRGAKGHQSTNYRKGACQNCGAMGHIKKQCTQRPRKLGAKFTSAKIAADDIIKDIPASWEVKRDRWNGYTPDMYKEVIEDFSQYEQVRKKIKGDDLDADVRKDDNPLSAAALPTKQYKQKFQGLNSGRNRQDKAKYLLNLDVNSAEFDPKSRTLQGEDQYLKQLSNLEAVGEKAQLTQLDNFAMEQVERHHAELNSTALPTLTQKIFKNVKQKKMGLSSGKMGEIMKKYGVEEQMPILQVEQDQNQAAEMYLRAKKVVKSRYEEDVFINDHLSVWGSWYSKYLGWGFACCYATDKFSYCPGIKGREKALAKEMKIRVDQVKQLQKLNELEKKLENDEQEQS